MRKAELPVLHEFDFILEKVDNTGKDVLILALLDYCESESDYCAVRILPPYLYILYEEYKKVLHKHWESEEQGVHDNA